MGIELPPQLKGKKASEAFMEYVAPFLETLLLDRVAHGINDIPSPKEFEHILKIPWLIWNAIVAEKDPKNKIDLLEWFKNLTCNLPESTKTIHESLIRRKRSDFSQYEYYLGKYEIYYDQHNQLRCKAEARDPNTN